MAISVLMDDKKVISSGQHGFIKGKSCLVNQVAFYGETTTWRNKERAVDNVYSDFSKAFNTVFHNLLLTGSGIADWMSGQ